MIVILPFLGVVSLFTLASKNRYLIFLCSCLLIFCMWILFGFSETPDLPNYRMIYNQSNLYSPLEVFTDYYGRDIGYIFINSIFSYLGFDFDFFHAILAGFWLWAMVYFSRKVTKSTLMILFLYFLWPFFIDVIQIRAMIVNLMVFIAIYAYSKDERLALGKAILTIILAGSIHSMAFIYLPFFILRKIFYTKIGITIALILSILMPIYIVFVGNYLASVINLFVYLQGNDTISSFSKYDLIITGFEKYARWLYVNGVLALMYFMKKQIDVILSTKSTKDIFIRRYFTNCYTMSLYTSCFMPLYAMTGAEFGRIERCFLIAFIVALVSYINIIKNDFFKVGIFIAGAGVLFLAGLVDLYKALGENVIQILTDNALLHAIGL